MALFIPVNAVIPNSQLIYYYYDFLIMIHAFNTLLLIIIFRYCCSACRHGSRAGLTETYEGHQGPVTGISAHAVQGGIDFSHLFLTSSLDWTIKLWSLKENKPLYSFEHNGDYVYDVAWSPTHPALFAAVDDSGRLDLWNLNQDTEVPTASVVVDGCPALNRVSWTPSGLHVTVGDDTGKIWVYDVAEVRTIVVSMICLYHFIVNLHTLCETNKYVLDLSSNIASSSSKNRRME